MIRLRPYNVNDADEILSWSSNETSFYKWSAGVLGDYPITKEQFGFVNNLMAFTAIDDDNLFGFFTIRISRKSMLCLEKSGSAWNLNRNYKQSYCVKD